VQDACGHDRVVIDRPRNCFDHCFRGSLNDRVDGGVQVHVAVAVKVHDHDHDHVKVNALDVVVVVDNIIRRRCAKRAVRFPEALRK
jgi:hypothetical protein